MLNLNRYQTYQSKPPNSKTKRKHSPQKNRSKNNIKNAYKSQQGLLLVPVKNMKTTRNEVSYKNSLFSSMQEAPISDFLLQQRQRNQKKQNKKVKQNYLYTNLNEVSTVNRKQQPLRKNKYSKPNKQYFGSKYSPEKRYPHSKRKNESVHSNSSSKMTKSINSKINLYRQLASKHSQQCSSLKSDVSQKQIKRLQKLQQIEKWEVLQEINHMKLKFNEHTRKK